MKSTLSILFFVIVLISSHAQQTLVKFESLTREDGLANTVIQDLIQDADGFLWMGTEGGLHRWDGYGMKVYRHQPGDSNSLTGNFITCLHEDRTGTIWIAASGGLNRLDKSKDNFRRYRGGMGLPDLFIKHRVNAITEDEDGFIWLAVKGMGLIRFDPRNDKFDLYGKNEIGSREILALHKDPRNNIWVGTTEGIFIYNIKLSKFSAVSGKSSSGTELPNLVIRNISGDGRGNLWIGTSSGLAYAQVNDGVLTSIINYVKNDEFGLSGNNVNDVVQDKSGKVWIATENGLDVLNTKTQRIDHYYHDDKNIYGIINNVCHTLLEDRQGIVWIGTDAGVSKFDTGRFPFQLLNSSTGFPADNVSAIKSDRYDILWVGSTNGLVRYDWKQSTIKVINRSSGFSLHDDRITRIAEDKAGWLWVGTESGLIHFNKVDQFIKVPELGNASVLSLGVDTENNLWIGTSRGLFKYNEEKHPLSQVFTTEIKEPVQSILCDKTDEIWIGTDRKLIRLVKDGSGNQVAKTYTRNVDDPATLSYNNISALYQARDGKIWIGTQGGGLNYFNKATESFTHFTWDDGLPSDDIRAIDGDGKGNLWVTTDKGVSRFDPLRRLFTNFDRNDGLQSNVFNPGAAARTNRGELFFGGVRGMNSIFADSVQTNLAAPKIVINDFQIRYKSVKPGTRKLPRMISETEELDLEYKDRVITFGFVGVNHRDPAKNKYAYKLEGFEEDWNYAGADRRYATYTNLNPGKYTFAVKCMNTDGVWSKEAEIRVIIAPPFWKTWWFYVLCAAVLCAAGYAYYIRKSNELEFVKSIMEQQITRRTNELRREKELGEQATLEIEKLKKQIESLKKNTNR